MDDFLDRYAAELYRRVDTLVAALRAVEVAEASRDAAAISQAEEAAWQARLALAELAFGNALRDRMKQESALLDNLGDDPETEHRRMLLGLSRLMLDVRSIGSAKLSDLVAGDALVMLDGETGKVLHPVGPGSKAYNVIERHWIRRYVLRVFVECVRTGSKNLHVFLQSLPRAPERDRFRDWSQLIHSAERARATKLGRALRVGKPLSADAAALWAEIKDDDLDEVFGYIVKLPP